MHHLTRAFFNTLVLGTLCTASVLLPADALACGPPAPGLNSHIPADGAWYPANGILLFDGFSISLDQVTVTVDGAPAMLVDASAAFPTGIATLAARVSPKPNPEQKVTISGSFCSGCATESFTFTARTDDLIAPEGIVSAHYGVHDYADFQSGGGDCQSSSDLGLWVHAQTVPANEEEAPSVLQIEAFADSNLSKPMGSYTSLITTNEGVWGYRVLKADLQGANPAAVCFRLSTKDLSGNDGPEPLVVCNACYSRTDAQGGAAASPPAEPMWGDADAIKGGPCDWGAGVGPGEEASCSYGHEGSSKGASVASLLGLAMGLFAFRKRARRLAK